MPSDHRYNKQNGGWFIQSLASLLMLKYIYDEYNSTAAVAMAAQTSKVLLHLGRMSYWNQLAEQALVTPLSQEGLARNTTQAADVVMVSLRAQACQASTNVHSNFNALSKLAAGHCERYCLAKATFLRSLICDIYNKENPISTGES